jgi:hypothetical protein
MLKKSSVIDVTQKLIGNNGFKYFLKNLNYRLNGNGAYFDKKRKPELPYFNHIIPEELINYSITDKNNIVCPLVIDTEFTSYISNIEYLTKKKLQNPKNRQLIQIERLDKLIKKYIPDLKSIYELTGMQEVKEIDIDLLDIAEKVKSIPTIHLTSQIKHVLYDDAEILVNLQIKELYEENIKNPDYLYPYYTNISQSHIFDYLSLKGFKIEISKKNDLDKKEFKKYKTCTFKLYAYFLLADLPKIFQNELLEDLKEAFRTKKITQERRLKTNGYTQQWHNNRLININDLSYRLVFDLVDLGAMQGNISFNNVLENLNMNTSDKNLLDDLKDNMLLAMLDKPEDFKKYALGDLKVYEAFNQTNNLFKKLYQEAEISNYFTEIKLTTGATINDYQQNILLNYLNLKIPNKENIKSLHYLTKPASAGNLRKYINANEKIKSGSCLKRHYLSKTMGGRCYNNRIKTNTTSNNFSLADIDISGAYPTTGFFLPFYFGSPVIQNFIKHKVSLREWLKYYEKKYLSPRCFKLAVETIKPFTIEQDLIPSWTELRYTTELIKNNQEVLNSLDLENTPTAIYTRELINATLTWDELDIIRTEWNSKQRDEFLDNTYMIGALFYPKNFECKTKEELKSKSDNHQRFIDSIPYSVIDNEDGEYSHYWHSTNFGELILNDLIQKRAENKKSNPSLAYLFKLASNTVYGVNVSRHFVNSNILLAANITAMCRSGMWLTEKALNIYQTITDGGICELNEVIHLIGKKIDTLLLVRAYQLNNRDLARYKKYSTKPITENGKKIEYHQEKGWLIDDVYYADIDRELYVKISKEYERYKKNYGEKHNLTKQKEEELKFFEEKIKKVFNKINDLIINHIRKVFPNNSLFNDYYRKIKVDEKEIAIRDENNKYIYEDVKGIFKFEVKNMCNSVSFHGSADYMYTNLKEEITTKMRGYDVKANVVAWRFENNNLIPDVNYYNEIPPIQRFLDDILKNPKTVTIQPPFTKTSILKTAQYSKEYNKTFQHSNLKCGDDFMEVVRLPILTLRFKFQTHEQQKSWVRYENSLKRKYGGLSFEIFYMNKDGTINYEKMMFEIDKHISNSVINPKKIYDKYNNLKRDIQKNHHIQKYIVLIKRLKNLVRSTIIGGKQFILENYTLKNNDVKYSIKKEIHYTKPFYNSYDDVTTYSDDKAFRDYKNKE